MSKALLAVLVGATVAQSWVVGPLHPRSNFVITTSPTSWTRVSATPDPSATATVDPRLAEAETVAFRLESAFHSALQGSSSEITALLEPSCEWNSQTGGTQQGTAAIVGRLQALGEAVESPSFVITGVAPGTTTDSWLIEWSFSANWKLPWRPRGRVGGTADIRVTGGGNAGPLKVQGITDELRTPKSLVSLALGQLAPRLYDLLNVFATPHAEFPESQVVERCDGYVVREVAPQLVLKISEEIDPSMLQNQQASFLPGFAFTGKLKLRGKNVDDYVTTSPLTSFVETVPSELFPPKTRRVTFFVPVPSAFGLDPRALPAIPALDTREPGELVGKAAGSATVEYMYLPRHRIAVVPFGMDDPISSEGNEARQALLAALKRDGRAVATSPSSGKPLFSLRQNTAKMAWSRKGVFGMAVYTARPGFARENEISTELV